jgi:hypothetical protein
VKLATRLKGFSDQELVEGVEPAQSKAQEDLRREQRLRVAMQSGRPELPRSDLIPAHLSLLEHVPTGEFYGISRGEQYGASFDGFDAFFVDGNGDAVFLQHPSCGPRSRGELEEMRAAREARRAAPKPKPSWMTG